VKIGEWLCKEGNKNAAAIIAKCLKKRSSQTPWLSAFANFLNSIILFRGVK